MTASAWTEERIGRLKILWHEGWTAEQIAGHLGNGVSRSAVLGKVHRLGLSEGRPARPGSRKTGAGRPRKTATGPARAGPEPGTGAAAPAIPPPARPAGAPDILALRRGQCRWPYGDPGKGLVFCGRPVERGAFCAGHAAVGYRAPSQGSASLLALSALD